MSDNLKSKTEKALIWSFFDKFGQQILYFVSGVILANILMPSDYGKIGLLALFTALSNILIDSGFGSALIRKREATETDYATVFYFNIVLSVFFYAILFFSSFCYTFPNFGILLSLTNHTHYYFFLILGSVTGWTKTKPSSNYN